MAELTNRQRKEAAAVVWRSYASKPDRTYTESQAVLLAIDALEKDLALPDLGVPVKEEKEKGVSAPSRPTSEEVTANNDWHWEYDQSTVDVSQMDDPPDSRPPLVVIRRRMVGPWDTYDPE